MAWVIIILIVVVAYILNVLLGIFTGYSLSPAAFAAGAISCISVFVTSRIQKNTREEEYILGQQKKADEAYRQTEEGKKEEFEKLPTWKRLELQKQQEAAKQPRKVTTVEVSKEELEKMPTWKRLEILKEQQAAKEKDQKRSN